MDESLAVNILYSLEDLKSDHDNSFQREGFTTLFE